MLIWSMAVFWAGAIVDWYTTKRGLEAGLRERNPLLRALMNYTNRDIAMTLLKAGAFGVFLYLKMPPWAYIVAGGAQAAAAVWNTIEKEKYGL